MVLSYVYKYDRLLFFDNVPNALCCSTLIRHKSTSLRQASRKEWSQNNNFPCLDHGTCHSYKNIYFAILVRDGSEISIKTIIICCLLKPVIFLPFLSFLTMQLEPPKQLARQLSIHLQHTFGTLLYCDGEQ